METMHFFIVQTSFSLRTKIVCISGVPMNDLAPMKNCPGGCKVGQISSRGTWGQEKKFLRKNPSVLLALVQILLIWVFHLRSFVIVTPRYLMLSTFFNTVPSRVYEASILFIRLFVSLKKKVMSF